MTDKKRFSFETVGTVAAVIVGVAALFIAWDEARSVRRQQAASVMPVLKVQSLNLNQEDGTITTIFIENIGVGPAFIEHSDIRWNGEELSSMEEVRNRIDEAYQDFGFWTSRIDGEMLGGGADVNILSVTRPAAPDTRTVTSEMRAFLFTNLELEVCFCSIYEDCWTTYLNKKYRPDLVKQCRRDERPPA